MHPFTTTDVPVGMQNEFETVGIVGAGIMGTAIAAANLREGLAVGITDLSAEVRDNAERELRRQFIDSRISIGSSSKPIDGFLEIVEQCSQLPDCGLVIEAVSEDFGTKCQVLQDVESATRSDSILASNTSAISISALAQHLKHPERFCGIHFLAPVHRTRLIEIIPGADTSQATTSAAVAYARRLHRFPIVVGDSPGFLVNRLLFPYLNEALLLLSEGVSVTHVDRAAQMFGMENGPFQLLDLIGLDTVLQAGRSLWRAYSDRFEPSPILPAMVKAGLLGTKTGAGFYRYAKSTNSIHENAEARTLVAFYVRRRREVKTAEVVKRLFLPMLLEATRLIEEEVVDGPDTIDFALTQAFGLSRNRNGLLRWADQIGADRICRWVEPLEYLGPRMLPTPSLLDMAGSSRTFH